MRRAARGSGSQHLQSDDRPQLHPYPQQESAGEEASTQTYTWRWGRLIIALFALSVVVGAGGRVGWELLQQPQAAADGDQLKTVHRRIDALSAEVKRQSAAEHKREAKKARKRFLNKVFWESTYPFYPIDNRQPTDHDALPDWWDNGDECSSYQDCTPLNTVNAWPLRPFHQPRPIISFFDDARPSSLHHGIDIAATTGQKVYAIQPGYAHIVQATGYDARVQVGDFIYWHIDIDVEEGQYVEPLSTVVGRVQPGFGHLHLAEVDSSGTYINPLRNGREILPGWSDTLSPVIGRLAVSHTGLMTVSAYDRQSMRWRKPYITPPTSLAALAYRLWDGEENRLQFAYQGTRNHDFSEAPLIYVASPPFDETHCYQHKKRCPYSWEYLLAGGFAPSLPTDLSPGSYQLTVYAWDWDSGASARDFNLHFDGSDWELSAE